MYKHKHLQKCPLLGGLSSSGRSFIGASAELHHFGKSLKGVVLHFGLGVFSHVVCMTTKRPQEGDTRLHFSDQIIMDPVLVS